ncbi:MAG TPA: YceI family protein [Actinomycetota bacterium]|jgi:polyisoprenoid-binding protein YceI|nr:YceI family protein [Actinomycetota bacterium]
MAQASNEVDTRSFPPAGRWELDPAHTTVEFVARHMLTKVRGRFTEFSGGFEIGERPEDAKVGVEIRAGSIQTNTTMRDDHLKSPDFLDVETFPVLSFSSTAFRPTGGTEFELEGDLTIKDVTRQVTLKGEVIGWGPDTEGTPMLAASAKTTIDREDWGMTWNMVVETGGFLVSKRVDIEIETEARLRS